MICHRVGGSAATVGDCLVGAALVPLDLAAESIDVTDDLLADRIVASSFDLCLEAVAGRRLVLTLLAPGTKEHAQVDAVDDAALIDVGSRISGVPVAQKSAKILTIDDAVTVDVLSAIIRTGIAATNEAGIINPDGTG